MSKPRTQAELDEQERLERSIEEAAYIDYGIQRWKRRHDSGSDYTLVNGNIYFKGEYQGTFNKERK